MKSLIALFNILLVFALTQLSCSKEEKGTGCKESAALLGKGTPLPGTANGGTEEACAAQVTTEPESDDPVVDTGNDDGGDDDNEGGNDSESPDDSADDPFSFPVTFTAPAAEVKIGQGAGSSYNVQFSVGSVASDLTLTLYYRSSNTGCETDASGWTQLATGLTKTDTSYSWNTSSLIYPNSYYLCIKATDGVATSYTKSTGYLTFVRTVYVAFYDQTNGDLKFAHNKGADWVTETIESANDVGKYVSMAVDSSKYIHLSYYDATNGNLRYSTNKSGAWVSTNVDTSNDVGTWSSIAVDGDDNAHIAYRDVTNGALRYATNKSGSWAAEEVLDSYDPTHINILITENDKPVIGFISSDGTEIRYVSNTTGSWSSATSLNQGGRSNINNACFVLETSTIGGVNGAFHGFMGHHDGSGIDNNTFTYHHHNGFSFSEEVWVSMASGHGRDCSTTTGIGGKLHVVESMKTIFAKPVVYYFKGDPGADNDDSQTAIYTFPTTSSAEAKNLNLTLDISDKAYVTFYDSDAADLKFGTNRDGTWTFSSLATGGVGQYSAIGTDTFRGRNNR